jgi:hypothetical protein
VKAASNVGLLDYAVARELLKRMNSHSFQAVSGLLTAIGYVDSALGMPSGLIAVSLQADGINAQYLKAIICCVYSLSRSLLVQTGRSLSLSESRKKSFTSLQVYPAVFLQLLHVLVGTGDSNGLVMCSALSSKDWQTRRVRFDARLDNG